MDSFDSELSTFLNVKHTMDDLIYNIYKYDFVEILKTQDLTEEFAVNYILNPNYQLTENEKNITILNVLDMQPHMNKNKLLRLYFIGPLDTKYPSFE